MLDLLEPTQDELIARLTRPAPLPGGYLPEQRVVFGGVGWENHLALDEALGHDRPGPRFYYLDDDLEIMSTSEEHERIKSWIGRMRERLPDRARYYEHAARPGDHAAQRTKRRRAG